jgi:undecaprenyl-diphosphatase
MSSGSESERSLVDDSAVRYFRHLGVKKINLWPRRLHLTLNFDRNSSLCGFFRPLLKTDERHLKPCDRGLKLVSRRYGIFIEIYVRVAVAVALALGFLFLSTEVQEAMGGRPELIHMIDQWVLTHLAEIRSPRLSSIAVSITALGSVTVLTLLTGFCSLLLYAKHARRFAVLLLVTAAGSAGITQVLKAFFERSRPDLVFRLVSVEGYSYPSGHSVSAAAIYVVLGLILSRFFDLGVHKFAINLFFAGLVVAIGLSRIYLGVHFTSDVLAGFLAGLCWCTVLLTIESAHTKTTVRRNEVAQF